MSTGKKIVPIKYTAKDFTTIKNELVEYAKRYYPDTYKDFNEAGFGSMMLDSVAYIGDILSFYTDYNANESHLKTSIELDNILKHGYKLGYKYNPSPSSMGIVAIYCLLPKRSIGVGPDYAYAPILKRGTVFQAGGNSFTLTHDINVANPMKTLMVGGNSFTYEPIVRTARTDSNNSPILYAIKFYGTVISGVYRVQSTQIGNFTKFAKITMNDSNVSEIISVIDAEGNEYFEVDYLSQNILYKVIPNTTADASSVQNILVPVAVPRRFVVERYNNVTTLVFGASSNVSVENDEMLEDPNKLVAQLYGRTYVSDESFDPKKLLNSDKFGIGPANTTLTINYRVNTVENVNASVGSINSVGTLSLEFINQLDLDPEVMNTVRESFVVENEEPIVGDVTIPTNDELKIRILDNFAAQHRAVTEKDYEAVCYSMPGQLGAIKRVKVIKDQQSFKRNLNLYVLSENSDGQFTNASLPLKNNLKTWLSKNKMISDTIDILDAKILNLGIEFNVTGVPDKSKYEVLDECLKALRESFARKPEIGEPFYLTDILYVLKRVDSVLDVKDVRVYKKVGLNYSRINLNVDSSLGSCRSPDEAIIEVPFNVVWEIKFIDNDITGNVF